MRAWANLAAGVFAASIGLAAASAADDLPVLSWQPKDAKDPMTDVVTHTAVGKVDFTNGTTLEASAKCDKLGVEFSFSLFSGGAASSLAWEREKTQVRVRIDNGHVQSAMAAEQHTNEANALFYEPDTARKLFTEAFGKQFGHSCDPYLCKPIRDAQVKVTMDQLGQRAEGTLAALANARSIRLELTLTDGRADAFELNPRDQSLGNVVQACVATLHASTGEDAAKVAAEKAAKDRAERAELVASCNREEAWRQNCLRVWPGHTTWISNPCLQEMPSAPKGCICNPVCHVGSGEVSTARARESPRPNESGGISVCIPGQKVQVRSAAEIEGLDMYDPRVHPRGHIFQRLYVSAGARVTVASGDEISLPSNATVPNGLCVVSYTGPEGHIVGTLHAANLAAVK
jgi:hypothetical protein